VFSEINGDDLVGQAAQFLAAGFETSGSKMSYALYELALYPEIQNRLEGWTHAGAEQTQRRVDIWWHTGNGLPGHGCVRWVDWSRLYYN